MPADHELKLLISEDSESDTAGQLNTVRSKETGTDAGEKRTGGLKRS